jgi:lysophospholipase
VYDQSVLPVPLQGRFLQHEDWRWGYFTNADGARLRTGWADPRPRSTIRATAITLPGFGGFAEQWFELYSDLLDRGIAVRHLDWNGQGGSDRHLGNSHKMHSRGYGRDVRDLHTFIEQFIEVNHDRPVFLLAHSMGAHIAMRYLAERADAVAGAFLTAPMLAIHTEKAPPTVVAQVAAAMTAMGLGERYILGHEDWWFREHYALEDSRLSQDPVRYRVAQLYYRLEPSLRIGGGTWRWLHESFRSIRKLRQPRVLREIRTPLYIASTGKDVIVDSRAHSRAARHLPDCTLEHFSDAKHDIWMESDAIRGPLLESLDRFLAEKLGVR